MAENDVSPYKGEGETVYATEPGGDGPSEDRGWPDHTDAEWLHQKYNIFNLSTTEMADLADISTSAINYQMRKHGIERRKRGKASSMATGGDEKLWDREWLEDQYIERGLNGTEIAEKLSVSHGTVYNALERHGIETRHESESVKNYFEGVYGDRKYNDEEWLRHQYTELGKSMIQIANENDWSKSTVRDALIEHGIKSRSKKAAGLTQYKKRKCPTDGDERQFVSSSGIDMSWRDINQRDTSCWIAYRDPEWLREKVEEGLTLREMAESCPSECCIYTIRKWLNKFDIDREKHPNRLSDETVREIREKYKTGNYTQPELADDYDISRSYVSQIVCGAKREDSPGPIKGEDYDVDDPND